jgi:hypothetical protein
MRNPGGGVVGFVTFFALVGQTGQCGVMYCVTQVADSTYLPTYPPHLMLRLFDMPIPHIPESQDALFREGCGGRLPARTGAGAGK